MANQAGSEDNSTAHNTHNQLALAEFQILQAVIARQDEFQQRTKSLAVTLFTAVSVGYFSGEVTLTWTQYVSAILGICSSFVIVEAVYGVTERHAEGRVKELEDHLCGKIGYEGPCISTHLLQEVGLHTLGASIKRWRTWALYAFLAALAFLAHPRLFEATHPSKKSEEKQLLQQLREDLNGVENATHESFSKIEKRMDAMQRTLDQDISQGAAGAKKTGKSKKR